MAVSPPTGPGDDDVERRLIQVSERLERASSDLQSLVDQLRQSFQQSSLDDEQDRQEQRDEDDREDGNGTDGLAPEDPNTPPSP